MNWTQKDIDRLKGNTDSMTEHDHQKEIVAHLRKNYHQIKFSVNPFSGVEFHRMSKAQKARFLNEMKLLGWETSQPDIIIHASRCGFSQLAIELKRPSEYPFRYWRISNDFFIDRTKSDKKKSHLMNQASYLHYMREEGALALFCGGADQAIKLIELYFDNQSWKIDEALVRYYFKWQHGGDKWIYRLR